MGSGRVKEWGQSNSLGKLRLPAKQSFNLIKTWDTERGNRNQSHTHQQVGVKRFSSSLLVTVIPFSIHRDLCKRVRSVNHIIQIPGEEWKEPVLTEILSIKFDHNISNQRLTHFATPC
jgi:hypothetical protein